MNTINRPTGIEAAEREAIALLVGIEGLKVDPTNERLRVLLVDSSRLLADTLEGKSASRAEQE